MNLNLYKILALVVMLYVGSLENAHSQCTPVPAVPDTPTSPNGTAGSTVCSGQVITLNTSTVAGSNIEYVWFMSDFVVNTQIGVTTSPTINYTVPAVTTNRSNIRIFTVVSRRAGCSQTSNYSSLFTLGIEAPAPTLSGVNVLPKRCINVVGGIHVTSILNGYTISQGSGSENYYLTISPAPPNGATYHISYNFNTLPTSPSQLSVYAPSGVSYIPLVAGVTYTYQLGYFYQGAQNPISVCQPATGTLPVVPDNTNQAPNVITFSSVGYDCALGYVTGSVSGGNSSMISFPVDGQSTSNSAGLPNQFRLHPIGPYFTNGTHTIVAVDQYGCTSSAQFTVLGQPLSSYNVTRLTYPCPGTSTGSVSIDMGANAGVAPLEFKLDGYTNYSTNNVFSNLGNGNYTFSIKGADGCTWGGSFSFNTQPISQGAVSMTLPSCPGSSDGSIQVVGASGNFGSSTLMYSLGGPVTRPFQSSNLFTGLPSGTYTITYRNENNCTSVLSNQVLSNPQSISASYSQTSPSCIGSSDGTVTINALGGTSPYTYSKDNSTYQPSNTLTGFSAGTNTLWVKDQNGCVYSFSATVSPPAAISASYASTPVSCNGGNNGSITVINVTGGTGPPYTYSKDGTNFQPGNVLTGLTAGSYTITVKDQNGCIFNLFNAAVAQPSSITASAFTVTPPSCFGGSNGSITVNAGGGTPLLTYSKDGTNFSPTNPVPGLSAGAYTITVKDANGCTTSFGGTLMQPTDISITSVTPTATICNGGTSGSIAITAVNGTGTLVYSKNGTTFQTGNTFPGLTAATYTITVRDQNSCTKTTTASVSQPVAITATVAATAASCNGVNDGTLTVSPTTGTGVLPFNYSLNGTSFQPANLFTGLAATGYTVTIRDANSCTITKSATITQPAAVSGTISVINAISCSGGSDGALSVIPSGGTPSYTYVWQHGPIIQSVTGLTAASYSVEITDSKGCKGTVSSTLGQPLPVSISSVLSNNNGFNIRCKGESNGFIDITVSGGNGAYTYAWSHGPTTQDISSQPAGTYTVNINDSKNCLATETIILTEPDLINSSFSAIQHVSCFGGSNGSLTLTSSKGAGGYTYSINGGSTFDASPTISGLPSGNYSIITRDVNTCTSTISQLITSPTALSVSLVDWSDTKCGETNGSAEAGGVGGAGGYGFTWYNSVSSVIGSNNVISSMAAGAYQVKVTDQNFCTATLPVTINSSNGPSITLVSSTSNTCYEGTSATAAISVANAVAPYTLEWPNGQTTLNATNLSSGTNTVKVTGNDGCVAFKSIVINSPSAIIVQTISVQKPSCFGRSDGSIEVAASGGNGTYSYLWTTGVLGNQLSSLPAGSYTVNVQDQLACVGSAQITVLDLEPVSIDIITQQNPSCNNLSDGIIEVSGKGGNGLYNYIWDTGSIAYRISGLNAKQYSITTTDNKGCSMSRSITLSNPEAITIATESIKNPLCFSNNDGAIDVTASGGNGQFAYLWSNNAIGKKAESLVMGNYSVTATDRLGCFLQKDFTLTQPLLLEIETITTENSTCENSIDGLAKVIARGGTGSYQYAWDNGGIGEEITNLKGGSYLVTVTDNANCKATKSIALTAPPAILINLREAKNPTCFGSSDGFIQIEASGGKEQFTYSWNILENTNIANRLKAGLYKITVTDQSGCKLSQEYTLTEPAKLTVDLGTDKKEICPNQQLTVGTDMKSASYTWSGPNGFASNNQDITTGTPGFYFLKITDNAGCTGEDSFELSVSNNLLHADFLMPSSVYQGDTIAMIDISWPLPEKIDWIFPADAFVIERGNGYALISFGKAGTYSIGIHSDLGGCSDDFTQPVTVMEGERPKENGRENNSLDLIQSFVAYPNPSNGNFSVTTELSQTSAVDLYIVNTEGNRVLYKFTEDGKNLYEWRLNGTSLVKGVYFLIVKAGKESKVLRMIIL